MVMQNDFARPGGTLTNAAAEALVPRLAQLLDRALVQHVRVTYTQDSHMEGDPEWAIWLEHCCVGTWGRDFIPELKLTFTSPRSFRNANTLARYCESGCSYFPVH
jgi:nicotinamidase-related amidase